MTCRHIQSHFNVVLVKNFCVLHSLSSGQPIEVVAFLLFANFHTE